MYVCTHGMKLWVKCGKINHSFHVTETNVKENVTSIKHTMHKKGLKFALVGEFDDWPEHPSVQIKSSSPCPT